MKTCSGHLWRAVILSFWPSGSVWASDERVENRAEHTGDIILGQGVVKMPTFMWRAGQRVTWILVEEEDNETEGVMYAPSNVHTLRIMSTTNCRHHAVSAPFDCTWGMATFSSLFPSFEITTSAANTRVTVAKHVLRRAGKALSRLHEAFSMWNLWYWDIHELHVSIHCAFVYCMEAGSFP